MTTDDDIVVVAGGTPRSVRFDSRVEARLAAYVRRHPGVSGGSVTNRFVDEALRMDEHPLVLFRDGPADRRAVLVGGPDVREIVRAVRGVREAEPTLDASIVLELVSENTGVTPPLIDAAIDYWSAYPDEIDSRLAGVDAVEADLRVAWERRQDLLNR